MLEYKIVSDTNFREMNDDISHLLKQGWQLYGNLATSPVRSETICYSQTLVRPVIHPVELPAA